MRVFVAGASGVLGRAVLRELLANGHEVLGAVRSERAAQIVVEHGGTPVLCDLLDAASVQQATRGADSILHLATAIPPPGTRDSIAWEMNDRLRREGTRNLLEAARDLSLKSLVLQSIAFVYGDLKGRWIGEDKPPQPDPVARSAVDAEGLALKAYRRDEVPVVILRGASFYSAESVHTRAIIEAVRTRSLPLPGRGMQYLHLVHVEDMAGAIATAVTDPAPGEIFNVADDWPVYAAEYLDHIANLLHVPRPVRMPAPLWRLVAHNHAGLFARSARYKTDKIKRMLGWAPRYPTYRDGLRQVLGRLGIPL